MMQTLKTLTIVVIFIITVELIRYVTKLPITVLDVILLPLTSFMVYIGLSVIKEKQPQNQFIQDKQSRWKLIQICVLSLSVLVLVVWCAFHTLLHPFKLYESAKGSAHGYSITYMSVTMAVYCFIFLYKSLTQLFKT